MLNKCESEVHIWYFDLPGGRIGGRRTAQEKTREVLARYLGVAPHTLHFERESRGKPLLHPSDRLSFNLSHAGSQGLLAVTYGPRIGVDIEALRPLIDPLGLAKRFFSPAEAEVLAALVDPLSAFFRAWVRKEAYLKALGGTVPSWLSRFAVSVGEGDPRIIWSELEPGMESRFSLVDIDSPTGYIAALAVEGEAGSVRVFRMNNTPGGT